MNGTTGLRGPGLDLPNWVPDAAWHYIAHTEAGTPIRELARSAGCHASTVLRQIRRLETRRDDPLIDAALRALGQSIHRSDVSRSNTSDRGKAPMAISEQIRAQSNAQDAANDMERDAARILRRLCETGAVLAVALDMEKAVVVRDQGTGATQRTAVADRSVAEYMALREWIVADQAGRITRYKITTAGRQALEEMLATVDEPLSGRGFAEDGEGFADQHRQWGEKTVVDPDDDRPRRYRYNLAESPLTALARRRDKDGSRFLSDELVSAGERLREDFELAQMGARVAQNWENFLTAGARSGFNTDGGTGFGPEAAKARVLAALSDLGPGLSDVVLRCCCYLEGLETTEKRLGWSARSGKIVLRIALMRLKQHYDGLGQSAQMIG